MIEIKNTKEHLVNSIADMQSILVDVGGNPPKEETVFQKVEDDPIYASCIYWKVVVVNSCGKCLDCNVD